MHLGIRLLVGLRGVMWSSEGYRILPPWPCTLGIRPLFGPFGFFLTAADFLPAWPIFDFWSAPEIFPAWTCTLGIRFRVELLANLFGVIWSSQGPEVLTGLVFYAWHLTFGSEFSAAIAVPDFLSTGCFSTMGLSVFAAYPSLCILHKFSIHSTQI